MNPPGTPEDGYHLSKDIADKTIEFIRDAKVIAPDKPWFSYVCPAPGTPRTMCSRSGPTVTRQFDMGYERYREIVLERQKSMGIVPQDTELSPVNPYLDVKGPEGQPWPLQDTVRPWDSLNDEEKRLFSRFAEVFADFSAIPTPKSGGSWTICEESGQRTTPSSWRSPTMAPAVRAAERIGERRQVLQRLHRHGRREHEALRPPRRTQTYNHYPIGWAMAFNTPYKLYKRYASHEGGIADSAIISWPNGIAAHGEIRDNYVNVSDITPTVYDLLNVEPPETVKGIPQKPLDGVSFKALLTDPSADTGKETQFYTMLGTRGSGTTAGSPTPSTRPHRRAGGISTPTAGSSSTSSRPQPVPRPGRRTSDKLEELKALWFAEAEKYNGLPLSD